MSENANKRISYTSDQVNRRTVVQVCGNELRSIAICVSVAALASALYAMNKPEARMVTYLLGGGFVGFCIYAMIRMLGLLFNGLIGRLPERPRVFAEGLKYVIGGAVGWILGVILVNTVMGSSHPVPAMTGEVRTFILVAAGIALVVGLLFRSYDLMALRLRQREWAERELEIARSIQARLLPPSELSGNGYAISARNLPAHYVAGDFYDVVQLDDGSIMMVLADVAGKGIGAGLIMSSVKAVLPFLARSGVIATMKALNAKLANELNPREFVAVICARYDPGGCVVEVANGGCPDPYLVTPNGVEVLQCNGERLPLGVSRTVEYSVTTARLQPGSGLLFISDGIPEAERPDGEPLGYEALKEIISAMGSIGPNGSSWLDRLLQEVRARVRTILSDDWTALLLELFEEE